MRLVRFAVKLYQVLLIIQFIIDAPGTDTDDGLPGLSPAKCTQLGGKSKI